MRIRELKATYAEDLLVWQRLNSAGEIIGIECVDHLIVGEGKYWSRQEARINA